MPRSEHTVSRADISEYALKVLYRLHKNGFQAYLVGGGVRDLLLGHHPKDFDIVTDATPEQVRSSFSNCRLIGRRFRLAHVFFGRHIIEVATFRGPVPQEGGAQSGMILRDNVYGTLEEDAWRRDFTVNALYYNIADFSLVDYTGGLKDLQDKVLRMIGDPVQRLREDPVRLLRAIRFAAKLDLQILPDLDSAMRDAIPLLSQVSSARLYEEVLKMFQGGAAMAVYKWFQEMGLYKQFFIAPENAFEEKLIERVMVSTDQRVKAGYALKPDFLLATLLWGPLSRKIKAYLASGENEFSARLKAMNAILFQQGKQLNLTKRLVLMIKDIWTMSFRLEKVQGKRAERVFCDYRFKTSYDLLVLRAQAGEPILELVTWWTDYIEANTQQRKGVSSSGEHAPKTPKKPKKNTEIKSIEISAPIQNTESKAPLEGESPFGEGFEFD